MRRKEEAYRILEAALRIASADVDEAEVSLKGGALGLVRFAGNQLHPSSEHVHERLAVRLSKGGHWARASTSDLSSQGITQLVQQARSELERLPGGSSSESLPGAQNYVESEAYDNETAGLHPLERTALAARAITAAHRAGVVASGLVAVGRGALGVDGVPRVYAMANTRGLLAYHPSTHVRFEVRMQADGRRSRVVQAAYAVGSLQAVAAVDAALSKMVPAEPVGQLSPGRYAVVLEPPAVASLMSVFARHVGAGLWDRGRSFGSGCLGDAVMDPRVEIVDDYRHPLHCGTPFDCDGVARKPVKLVEAGVLKAPVVSWATSLASDWAPTGHGIESALGARGEAAEHLVMTGGSGSTEKLIRGVRAGVLISRLGELEVLDPLRLRVTGSTADGTFAIESGERTVPLGDLRFDVSILEVFRRVRALGASEWAEGLVVPPLEVSDFPLYALA